jgi:hypothetical protein
LFFMRAVVILTVVAVLFCHWQKRMWVTRSVAIFLVSAGALA